MKRIYIALICFIIIISNGINVLAAPPEPPRPTYGDLGNGLVFYITPARFAGHDYPVSGLYRNGELIYIVEQYIVDQHILARPWRMLYFSDDAMSFLLMPMGVGEALNEAIHFYHKGVLVHTYDVRSLLRRGERSLIHPPPIVNGPPLQWILQEDTYYDRENNILQITTVENTVITFDLSTGLIISHVRMLTDNERTLIRAALTAVGVTVLVFTIRYRRRKQLP